MKKRWTLGLLVMTLVLAGGSSFSFAKSQKALIPIQMERCEEKFDSLDANEDDKVSLDEFKAIVDKPDPRVDQTFTARDANKDGFLTQGELCTRRGGSRTQKPAAKPPVSTP